MTVMEKIFEISKKLPNTLQKDVLDFPDYLMYRRTEGDSRSLNFGLKIHKRFQGLKFDELVIPPRTIIRNPPDLHYEWNRIFIVTNIISELMRESPEPLLLEWFENKKDNKFFISAITRAEILLGIELLPESKKKNQLKYTFDLIIEEDFRDQCLAFDEFETWSQFLIQICLLEYNA